MSMLRLAMYNYSTHNSRTESLSPQTLQLQTRVCFASRCLSNTKPWIGYESNQPPEPTSVPSDVKYWRHDHRRFWLCMRRTSSDSSHIGNASCKSSISIYWLSDSERQVPSNQGVVLGLPDVMTHVPGQFASPIEVSVDVKVGTPSFVLRPEDVCIDQLRFYVAWRLTSTNRNQVHSLACVDQEKTTDRHTKRTGSTAVKYLWRDQDTILFTVNFPKQEITTNHRTNSYTLLL